MSIPRTREVNAGPVVIGGSARSVLIAGPCVIESPDLVMRTGEKIKEITDRLGIPWILKSSFDKANRSSIESFRGPGLEEGLAILSHARKELDVPVTTDVHSVEQVEPVAEVADLVQLPALLCRQTDLLLAAGKAGKPVNIKKGQFMAPEDMALAAQKVTSTGNQDVLITERGTSFGYRNLVADMRSLAIIREAGYPVVFDATHSIQLPAAMGKASGGRRGLAPVLARAAAAAGVDALFMEVHPSPDDALCDGPNSLPLSGLEEVLKVVMQIDKAVKGGQD